MKIYEKPFLKVNLVSVEDIIITSDPTIQNGMASSENSVLTRERGSDWSNWEK